jgi:riboflavin kinase/FMN adenylyltransferase
MVDSCYGCAGERCLAGSVLVGVGEAYDKMKELVVKHTNNIVVGSGLESTTSLGPVISKQAKERIIAEYGIDYLVVVEFTTNFASQTSYEFVKNILVEKLKVKHLVLGYDHHFGKNREGRFDKLSECASEFGFTIEQVSALKSDNDNISSTKIRNALKIGDIIKANNYLGYNYSITGTVIKGEAIGRKIGFPTANIKWEDYKLIPANGVYAVKVYYNNKEYKAMVNVGRKPTVSNNEKTGIEVNIFDFNKDLYNKSITVEFITRIRDEQKFENINQLKAQLKSDKVKSIQLLK